MPGSSQSASPLAKIKQSENARASVLTLSNGVKLTVKKISPSLFMDIMTNADKDRPKPPVVFIESLGRSEENPADPDYQEALRAYNMGRSKKLSDMFLVMGTSLYECPPNIEGPESDGEWLQNARELGLDSKNTKRGRYLLWLKSEALSEVEDYQLVMEEVGKKSGVREADVDAAAGSFRPDAPGDTPS